MMLFTSYLLLTVELVTLPSYCSSPTTIPPPSTSQRAQPIASWEDAMSRHGMELGCDDQDALRCPVMLPPGCRHVSGQNSSIFS